MVPYSYFIHPDDEKAMNVMKSIPGFESAMQKFMNVGYERLIQGTNMASAIRLSDNQLPEIYHRVTRMCDKLDIGYPEVYLSMSPYPNAWTYGDTDTSITLTSALFDYLEDDEIDSVIAHECGHILCHHVLYHTMAEFLRLGTSKVVSKLTEPLWLAMMYWVRKSELSADRVAVLACGADTVIRTQLRLSGGPKSLTEKVNLKEWAEQAKGYEDFCYGNSWNRLLQGAAAMDNSHPFSAVRVREATVWSSGKTFQAIKGLMDGTASICPHCHKPIENGWRFCKHCGNVLDSTVLNT